MCKIDFNKIKIKILFNKKTRLCTVVFLLSSHTSLHQNTTMYRDVPTHLPYKFTSRYDYVQ